MVSLRTAHFHAFAGSALLFSSSILVGCGLSVNGVFKTSIAHYRAYGASITQGRTLSNPAKQAYPALVAEFEKVNFVNNALAGDQACDVPTRQIFPNKDSPTAHLHPTYTVLVGTNDVDVKGVGAYEAVFMLCHKALISWLAVPLEYKVLATSNEMKTSGPGSLDTKNNWNAWTTGGPGATVSFTITTRKEGPIYAWPRIDDKNPGTYSYSLDGKVLGAGSTQTTPRISTENFTTDSLGFLRLPVVSAGTHVVEFTQTSEGANGLSILGIGAPAEARADELPTVLVGNITYQLHGGSIGACVISDLPCLRYIQDIEADVNVFSSDGLRVRLFDTRKYMFGTAAEMNDSLHPNALGHIELSQAVEASWRNQ